MDAVSAGLSRISCPPLCSPQRLVLRRKGATSATGMAMFRTRRQDGDSTWSRWQTGFPGPPGINSGSSGHTWRAPRGRSMMATLERARPTAGSSSRTPSRCVEYPSEEVELPPSGTRTLPYGCNCSGGPHCRPALQQHCPLEAAGQPALGRLEESKAVLLPQEHRGLCTRPSGPSPP